MKESRTVNVLVVAGLVALFVALRLPAIIGTDPAEHAGSQADAAVAQDEPLVVGVGRHLLTERDFAIPPLLASPPLAHHLTGAGLWSLRTPVEPWDEAGPAAQLGWITLYDSRLTPDRPPLDSRTVAIVARIPVLLLGLLALELLRRLGHHVGGMAGGLFAGLVWCLHPGLASHGVLAGTVGVTAAVGVVALTAAVDVGVNPILEGREVTRRLAALGIALGALALSSYAALPLLAVLAVWVATRRAARRRRDDPVRGAPGPRAALVVGLATLTLWAGYLFEVGPAISGEGAHPLTDALGALAGLEAGALDETVQSLWLPAAAFWRGLGHTLLVEGPTPPGETLARLYDATPFGLVLVYFPALAGYWTFRRDRADTPSLLLAAWLLPLAAALVLPARLTGHCAYLAVPAGTLLAAATLARELRAPGFRRVSAVLVLAVSPLAFLAGAWGDRFMDARLASYDEPASDEPTVTDEERWLLWRWAASHGVADMRTVVGDEPGVSVRGDVLRREYDSADPALRAYVSRALEVEQEATGAARSVLVYGPWPRYAIEALGEVERHAEVEPHARLLRLRVYRLDEPE